MFINDIYMNDYNIEGGISLRLDDDLLLETIELKDAEVVFATIDSQREYLGKWLPFVKTTQSVEDTKKFIGYSISAGLISQEYVFKISYRNEFAGLIGFGKVSENRKNIELGYWLSERFRHKGIIIRSAKLLCAFAFEKLSIPEVIVRCAINNTDSRKIPEQLGFQHIKTEVLSEQLLDGSFTDIVVYSLEYQNFKR